jgi:hypothetical protein
MKSPSFFEAMENETRPLPTVLPVFGETPVPK